MGTYEDLKAAIQQVIRTNGNNEITGALLQNALLSIVNVVGANATFAGIATPNTNPGTADQNVFYLATEAGTYVNFDNIEIDEGEAVILWNKTGNWTKTISGFATQQQLNDLEQKTSGFPFIGIVTEIYQRPASFVKWEGEDCYFLALGGGEYSNFGELTLNDGEIAYFIYYQQSWIKQLIATTARGFQYVGTLTERAENPRIFPLWNDNNNNMVFATEVGEYENCGGLICEKGEVAIFVTLNGEWYKLPSVLSKKGSEIPQVPIIASSDNYIGDTPINAIYHKGVWYNESVQNTLRGKPITSIVANFINKGEFRIVKGEGIGVVDINNFTPTLVQEFDIVSPGVQRLDLDVPLILGDNEYIGFYNRLANSARINIKSTITPSRGFWYTYNGSEYIWGYSELDLEIGINVASASTENDTNDTRFAGKRIAILGDSISTYQGYIPNNYQYFYPSASCPDVDSVDKTYWKIVADNLGLLVTNCSYSGSTCAEIGGYGVVGCSDERIAALGVNGAPDIIWIYIGINDWGYGVVELGDWTSEDALPINGNTFSDAYALMISKIQLSYPNAKIFCSPLLPDKARDSDNNFPLVNSKGITLKAYNDKIVEIANGLGVNVVNIPGCGISWNTIRYYYGDYSETYGIHPNAAGHKKMAAQLQAALMAIY